MLTFLLGVALTIPLSVLANIFTPRVQNYLSRRSITTIGWRREVIAREFHVIEQLKDSDRKLALTLAKKGISALYGTLALIFWVGIYSQPRFSECTSMPSVLAKSVDVAVILLGLTAATVVSVSVHNAMRIIDRVLHFDAYEATVRRKLSELDSKAPAEQESDHV